MSRYLQNRLDKLEARLPGCRQVRRLVVVREGEPAPEPTPPSPRCGDRNCGIVLVVEQIIVAREPDGTLVTERGTLIPPQA